MSRQVLVLAAVAMGCSSGATSPPGQSVTPSMDTGGAAGTGGVETAGVPGTGNAPGYGGTQGSGGYGAGGYMQSSGGIKGNGGYVGLGGGLGTGGLLGTGGIMIPPGTGGLIGAGGTVGAGGGMNNAGGAAPAGKMDPVIPMVSGDCPTFATGTITFMGLAGIQIASGAKPASPTAPMLFYWHGTGSTSGEYSLMAAPVAQGIQAAGGIIVSFQGSTGGDLLSGTSVFGQGDFKLTDQLAACAVRDRNIDPRKIYTMGCSAGGLFATAMAAMRSTYIAAAAPNSGGTVAPLTFQNAHTPALMTVHGKMGSDVVIVDFSQTSATADTAFKGKGGFVIDCDTGGGHCGGSGLAGDAWKFLQAHTFGIDPEPWTALPAGFSSQCMIK